MSFDLKLKSGDIQLENDGSISIVSGNQKIRQDLVKIILTKLGENRFHPQYGSNTGLLQIGSTADQNLLELDLNQSVQSATRFLMSLKRLFWQAAYLCQRSQSLKIPLQTPLLPVAIQIMR
jgi:hypothetical protein